MNKLFLSIDQQIELLNSRGVIADKKSDNSYSVLLQKLVYYLSCI